MADLVVRGGTVLTPDGPVLTDVHVTGGVISALGPAEPATEEVDATGLWVLPGAVDAHVHSRDPGQPEKEDFASLTAAAAAGGVTTVVDMPNTFAAVDSADRLVEKAAAVVARARVDFALWGLIRSSSRPEELVGMLEAGAAGLKAYLGYAFRTDLAQVVYAPKAAGADLEAPPGYGTLARLGPALAEAGALVATHAEDPEVLLALARPLRTYADLLAARPAVAEAAAVAALGELALATGLEVRLVHLSSAAGLAAAEAARTRGAALQLETCPQYVWLSEAYAERLGGLLKMYPPVRTAADLEALREGLRSGAIGSLATDHAPHTDVEKVGVSFEAALPGSPGVQSLYVAALELARRLGDPWQAATWVAEGPARALRLAPRKGSIAIGADADLVLIDPAGETVVTPETQHSRQRHSALTGLRFGIAVRAVWSRGELVARDGEVLAAPGRGRFIRPLPV
ncbi:MAG: dihydroorotase family protein [Candidatus Dormibacteraeota bacterium]|nr:dihydroorotase family protein [Candidatus Dormibacteraeota bacterium]